MLKILIADDTNPNLRNVGKRQLLEQIAWVHLGGAFPKEIKVSQWPDRETGELPKPYPKGEYTFNESSFSVGKYGDLECRPKLIPTGDALKGSK